MYRILKNRQKGFTLIELMIVVAIIGILAAVAIPQFLKMMDKSKSGEAELTLDLVKKGTKAQWTESNGFVVGAAAAATLPASGAANSNNCCGLNPDNRCTAEPDNFNADPVWSALDVRVDQNGYFVYDYSASAAGAGQTMSATASGDVNCNGVIATYDLEGGKDSAGGPVFALAKPGQTVTTAGITATGNPE